MYDKNYIEMKQQQKMTKNSPYHLQSIKSQKVDQNKQTNKGRIVAKTKISLNLSKEKNHISLCPQ